MASVFLFVFFLLSHLLLLLSAQKCRPFPCGHLGTIAFPFTNHTNPECGVFTVDCGGDPNPTIQLEVGQKERAYGVKEIIYEHNTIRVVDTELWKVLTLGRCNSLTNWTLPSSSFFSFEIAGHNQTFFKCKRSVPPNNFTKKSCDDDQNIYYSNSNDSVPGSLSGCSIIQLPKNPSPLPGEDDLFALLTEFNIQVRMSDECPLCRGGQCKPGEKEKIYCEEDCYKCFKKGGQCKPDDKGKLYCDYECYKCHNRGGQCKWDFKGKFSCVDGAEKDSNKKRLAIGLGVGCALILFIMICAFFVMRHHYKKKYASSNMLAKNANSDPSSRSDLEGGTLYYGVPVYSYRELEEATNNFDIEKELGDGGFGIVYYGKLRDGREVAVKRLYEHNYRRVAQFMNEVEILTRLRHKNLVSLYGCTSHRSRELLLVYEYIPNGTVADHIHGEQATPGSLTWPTRMSIAIETASALAYLHASEIIHRDVKTNNILLDNYFGVKVADFGLSRLFPTDVTHVSTAPQGTPGYVDPEYHQCYQLSTKSDVYSFGVVLIELISSLPAVDIARHRHEINLANLAINKIEKSAFHELIDPHLGFESDKEVERMTISVAQLAFQCIQQDKETRPCMDEVLEALKQIQGGNDAPEDQEKGFDDDGIMNVKRPISPESDELGLLRNKPLPPSPISVTSNWTSTSTTPNISS